MNQIQLIPNEAAGAVLSPCERYRYRLWRTWKPEGRRLVYIMLNPSTADASVNDATITRCMERARYMGFGGIEVVNLFAWRATNPIELKRVGVDTVGEDGGMENDKAIRAAVKSAVGMGGMVICGWGTHGKLFGRDAKVLGILLDQCAAPLHALKVNKDGSPVHPLYVQYDIDPVAFQRR